MSSIGRIIGHFRWILAGETLDRKAPEPLPEPVLYDILLRPGHLPPVTGGTPASRPATARSRFWRWVASPECLPQVADGTPASRPAHARSRFWRWMASGEQFPSTPGAATGAPARSRFWRWFLTPEQLPRTKDTSKAGTRNPRAES